MEKKSKKSIIIGITSLLLVTLILLGLTYAYYRTRIIGNTNDKSISVTSKLLELTYHDGTASFSTGSQDALVEPGFTYTKAFSVENTGSESLSYTIVLDNVANTFKRTGDWTYTLTNATTNEKITGIINKLSEQTILQNISIAADVTDNYELVVTYENLEDVDQSEDMGKLMSFRVNIKDPSEWDKASEGTLLYALRENNEVVEPLSIAGASPSGLIYTEGSWSNNTKKLTVSSTNQDLYWIYGTGYEYDEIRGTYVLTGVDACKYSECYTELEGKYINSVSIDSSSDKEELLFQQNYPADPTKGLSSIRQIVSTTSSDLTYKTKAAANKSTVTEALLSSTEDDYGTSYYFRGNVTNNFVTYAGMCWRIVRVQGDGGIKLVLADRDYPCGPNTENITEGENSWGEVVTIYNGYSTLKDESAFITDHINYPELQFGYDDMFEVLDKWMNGGTFNSSNENTYPSTFEFSQKITEENQKKLLDTEWCQDYSIYKDFSYGLNNDGNYVYDESLATSYWSNNYIYGVYNRLDNDGSSSATLKCDMDGAVKYNDTIGLLTADEMAFAGAGNINYHNMSETNYLDTNASSDFSREAWLLTPYFDEDSSEYVVVSYAGQYELGFVVDSNVLQIRPSVVLRSDVTIVAGGNGTQSNPYVIE